MPLVILASSFAMKKIIFKNFCITVSVGNASLTLLERLAVGTHAAIFEGVDDHMRGSRGGGPLPLGKIKFLIYLAPSPSPPPSKLNISRTPNSHPPGGLKFQDPRMAHTTVLIWLWYP